MPLTEFRLQRRVQFYETDAAGIVHFSWFFRYLEEAEHALWREAISLVERGICDAATVDMVVKMSFGRRLAVLGPLENADLVGTELTLAIHRTILSEIESSPGPSPYLEALVASGRLGMKSGEGFQTWNANDQAAVRERVIKHLKNARAADFQS